MAARTRAAAIEGRPVSLSIGQVLARLSADFPDLTGSKLRFLEEQGLVSPARTQSGYRKFSQSDVERLRLVLTMQREHYLPLKVIRSYLADLDAGRDPTMPAAPTRLASGMLSQGPRMDRDELLAATGASAALLRSAVSASLIQPADVYGQEAATVLRALVELEAHGIEPRHLRSLRASVERELGLIENAIAPLARAHDSAARVRAAESGREIAGRLETVRSVLIQSALTRPRF